MSRGKHIRADSGWIVLVMLSLLELILMSKTGVRILETVEIAVKVLLGSTPLIILLLLSPPSSNASRVSKQRFKTELSKALKTNNRRRVKVTITIE